MSTSNTLPSFGISGSSCTALADGMLSARLVRLFPGRCRTAHWLWSVWHQDELLSNGRKVEAALLISLFLSWYRLISHRILPRVSQVLNIPVSLEEQLNSVVNCFLVPKL